MRARVNLVATWLPWLRCIACAVCERCRRLGREADLPAQPTGLFIAARNAAWGDGH
jgi:hypothetical protein